MKKIKELLFLKSIKGIGKSAIFNRYWDVILSCESFEQFVEYFKNNEVKITSLDLENALKKSEALFQMLIYDEQIEIITAFDDDYPHQLDVMKDKRPLMLYVKGNSSILREKSISFIGTRHPSEWSREVEEKLLKKILKISEMPIVSGLAIGCDSIAHKITVEEKRPTIAVLPCGINEITPVSNQKLSEDIILHSGCLISEYEPNVRNTNSYYIERDQIIAALSDYTFVIECGVKSGTMHTVEAANKYKRRIGCYYTAETGNGDFSGNEYMVAKYGAFKVSNEEELEQFLNEEPSNDKKTADVVQLSIFDLK